MLLGGVASALCVTISFEFVLEVVGVKPKEDLTPFVPIQNSLVAVIRLNDAAADSISVVIINAPVNVAAIIKNKD